MSGIERSQRTAPPNGGPPGNCSVWKLSSGVFLAVFLLYLNCLSTTINRGGDGGELVSASWTLGVSHPSGYPIYMLGGRLFAALLPWGEPAWRYNVFSAISGAGAAALVAATIFRLEGGAGNRAAACALGGSLLLAGLKFFASQAIISEVYSLNGLLLAWLILCAIRWHKVADWRWFYTLALSVGCGFALHLSCIFLMPGLLYLAIWQHRDRFWLAAPALEIGQVSSTTALKHWAGRPALAASLAACALSLYLYLPLRSQLFPPPLTPLATVAAPAGAQDLTSYFYWPMDWGHPATTPALKTHIAARQYRSLLVGARAVDLLGKRVTIPWPARPLNQWAGVMGNWFSSLSLQLIWLAPLLPLGAVACFRDRAVGILLLTTVLANCMEFGYGVSDQANFFFPIYVVMAIWLGLGLGVVARGASALAPQWAWRARTFGSMLLAVTVLMQWALVATKVSLRGSTLPEAVALQQASDMEALQQSSVRPVSALLSSQDSTEDFLWLFWYVQLVLGRAQGVATPWGRAIDQMHRKGMTPQYVEQLRTRGPVVLAQMDESVDANHPLVPLDPSGALWLVSDRALPPAAVPTVVTGPTGVGGLITAAVHPNPHWKVSQNSALVLRGVTVPYDVNFETARAPVVSVEPPAGGAPRLAGYVELLLAPAAGRPFQSPAPNQGNVTVGSGEDATPGVLLQRRRLVLPGDPAIARQMRATIPLALPDALDATRYLVWTRLLPLHGGENTAWTQTGGVVLTVK